MACPIRHAHHVAYMVDDDAEFLARSGCQASGKLLAKQSEAGSRAGHDHNITRRHIDPFGEKIDVGKDLKLACGKLIELRLAQAVIAGGVQ